MHPYRVYVSGYGGTIQCFALDRSSGVLTHISTSDGGEHPSFLAIAKNGRFLYAVNEKADREGSVRAFAIENDTGACTPIGSVPSAGHGPCHLSLSPDGRWLFVAHYTSGHVSMLPVREDGGVEEAACVCRPGINAHMALPDATGAFLFVPCLGSDYVAQLRVDASSGLLTDNDPPHVCVPTGAGPRHIALADGQAYVVNELGSTVCTFAYDSLRGVLTPIGEPQTTLPEGFSGENFPAHIAVHPNGRFVYASNRRHESIAVFQRDESSGKLIAAGHALSNGAFDNPRGFTLDPEGRFLIVAGQDTGNVTVMAVDAESGMPQAVCTTHADTKPSCVLVAEAPQSAG